MSKQKSNAVPLTEMLADAYAEYRRARAAKDTQASDFNVRAFHRARKAINDLEERIAYRDEPA